LLDFSSVCITDVWHKVSLSRWDYRFSWQRMKMAVIWYVAPCSLVDINWHFRRAYCLHHQGDRGSKLLWNISQYLPYSQRNISEDTHVHFCM
jgi:hypothetical protein